MKIAFMYSGQGAQVPGMMKELYETYSESKKIFECADNVLKRSITQITFSGTEEELSLTQNTQPCVLAADLAAGEALKAHGVRPDVVAGFSVGEYAALCEAGVMSMEEAFKIIQVRAKAMQDAVPVGEGAMAAIIGPSAEEIEKMCKEVPEYVVPANYNSPNQTVVSGTEAGVNHIIKKSEEQGIRAVKLAVSAPFHCEMMKPASDILGREFETIKFNDPLIPIYMNVDALPLKDGVTAKLLMCRQAMSAVRWQQSLINMKKDGIDTFIECGPGKTLSGLVRNTLKDVRIFRVSDEKTLKKTIGSL